MPWRCEKVHLPTLAAARTAEEYALHQAALEWSLAEPIIIQNAEDIKSRLGWRDKLEPFAHQIRNLLTFCRRLPVTLLADDVGLGKTISAGLILSELMARRRVARTLVVCPKILAPQWEQELDEKFGITGKIVLGKDLAAEVRRRTPVVITTYQSARPHLMELGAGVFDMLILDEAHKVRNLYGTKAPPALAVRIRDALEKRLFKYVLMLTATPLQNRLWDLYSLIDCMTVAQGHRNPLGTPEQFQQTFLAPGTEGRKLKPERASAFRSILREYLVRTRRDDAKLKFPKRRVQLVSLSLTDAENRLRDLVAPHIEHLNPLQQVSLAQALMSSPQALAAQMENMAKKGTLPRGAAAEAGQAADGIPQPAKLAGLLTLLSKLRAERPGEWRCVVFTLRRETQELIGRKLEREGISYGYVRGDDAAGNQRSLVRFRSDPPQVHVIVSTDAGAEGVNLQVANVLVNYDLPWNPMIVEQRIGRIQRLASRHEFVSICNLIGAGTVEERIVARLMEKLQLVAHAIGDIEAILESVGPDEDDADGGSFEKKIRELVVRSLLGQDVRAAAEMARQSIEEAQRHLEERRREMDESLGRLDALHDAGPSMPRLARGTPSAPSNQFVLRAKGADGAAIRQISKETYEAQVPGQPKELITFNEAAALAGEGQGIFGGNPPRLYLPGKPAFERLTQHWVDRAGHCVGDLRPHDGARAEQLARDWCAKIAGATFLGAEFVPAQDAFQGAALIRAKTANAVDSYEKLIRGNLRPKNHEACRPTDGAVRPSPAGIQPGQIMPALTDGIARIVEGDRDMGEFCRFYEARLQEETGKAASDTRLLQKWRSDLTPLLYAEVVALEGARYSVGVINVRFSLEGGRSYQARLEAIPAAGQIVAEPARGKCALTGNDVPEPCLATCAVTRQRAIRHLLGRCEFSGVEVCPDGLLPSQVSGRLFRSDEKAASAVSGAIGHQSEFIRCEQTGQLILPAEAGQSDLSDRRVRKDLLRSSAKPPGRRGTAEEMATCAATGRVLLRDEAAASLVSGKWFDRDLLRPSARSGGLALPEEMAACEETGALLLPAETERCSITGKRVDSELLGRSEATGAIALKRFFVQCAKSNKWVLPKELTACDVTGLKVLPDQLEFCSVTGRRVLRERLLKSAASGRFVLPEKAVRSLLTGAVGLPDEIVSCAWLDGPILKAESGVCRLTGCTISRKFLNGAGELIPLRLLLDGTARDAAEDPATAAWLAREAPQHFAGITTLRCLSAQYGGIVAACAEVGTFFRLTLFGMTARYSGLLVRVREPRVILGRVVSGRRIGKCWRPDS